MTILPLESVHRSGEFMGSRAAWVALVIVASACGGSRHPVIASTGSGNGSDGGSGPSTAPSGGSGTPAADAGTQPPPPNADGGSAGGTPPDAGQPAFALGIVIQGQGVVTSDPAGIECAKACVGQFAAGEKIVLSAKPAAGWSFSGFRGACFGTDCTILKLAFTQFVEVVFTQDPPPLGVSSYTIVAIPPVVGASGGTFASISPASINSLGQVVGGFNDCVSIGMSECDSGPFSAFLYDPAKGTTVRIAHPAASDHTARAINDAGAIILNGNPFGLADGVVLSKGNATVFGQDVFVGGISSNGTVVGNKRGGDGQFAFLWDGTTIRQIAPAVSLGTAVNGGNVVVGSVFAGGRFHAAVFADGKVEELGTLPGDVESSASAINDSGRIVGSSSGDVFTQRAFVFDLPDGRMRDIEADGPSALSSVNANGDAVGSILSLNSPVRAILWHDGTVIDLTRALNDPTWQVLSATGINDKGQIIGVGMHDGDERAYVLTPK